MAKRTYKPDHVSTQAEAVAYLRSVVETLDPYYQLLDERYYDRSDNWQESERGLEFEEYMYLIEEIRDTIDSWADEVEDNGNGGR